MRSPFFHLITTKDFILFIALIRMANDGYYLVVYPTKSKDFCLKTYFQKHRTNSALDLSVEEQIQQKMFDKE